MSNSPIQKPVTPPYTTEVHTAAWEAWDKEVAELIRQGFPAKEFENPLGRKLFMDGFIKGLQA